MDRLFTLIDMKLKALQSADLQELGHIILNETLRLIEYRVAVLWLKDEAGISLHGSSGNSVLDQNSSYANTLKKFIAGTLKKSSGSADSGSYILTFPHTDTPLEGGVDSDYLLAVFQTEDEGIVGGLWLQRQKPFDDVEIKVLETLITTYAYATALFYLRKRRGVFNKLLSYKKSQIVLICALIAAALFPVRLTISAPAEIIARSPDIITVPYDGVLEKVLVNAGDKIQQNQVLAHMENLAQKGSLERSEKELEIAQAQLSRLQREALLNPEKRADLKMLQGEVRTRQIEYDYTKLMSERSRITSPNDGIAVFSDTSTLEGKPFRTGDVIMQIADTDHIELLVRVPVDAMTAIDDNADIRFFLNVDPLHGYQAKVIGVGYQATHDSDGLLTYKVRGSVEGVDEAMRIGWKGTAKIYGAWTVLSYAILKRPLIALRNLFGL